MQMQTRPYTFRNQAWKQETITTFDYIFCSLGDLDLSSLLTHVFLRSLRVCSGCSGITEDWWPQDVGQRGWSHSYTSGRLLCPTALSQLHWRIEQWRRVLKAHQMQHWAVPSFCQTTCHHSSEQTCSIYWRFVSAACPCHSPSCWHQGNVPLVLQLHWVLLGSLFLFLRSWTSTPVEFSKWIPEWKCLWYLPICPPSPFLLH